MSSARPTLTEHRDILGPRAWPGANRPGEAKLDAGLPCLMPRLESMGVD